ncbi:MAG TPA: hypothetical protein VG519_13410 [Pseudochrobactrum sp.]|nr:hypothetical protein [Pseudochrobactrum sp.]
MVISYPFNLLDSFPGWSTEFDLFYRQEYSRTAGGATIGKDFGTPLWKANFATRSLKPNELDVWRARLKTLEGSLQQFMGRPFSRCYPIAYPNGNGMGDVSNVKIANLNENNKAYRLSGLPVGYQTSVGDYQQIGNKLYQVVDVDGQDIEIRPHLAPGTAVGNVVTLIKPSVPMIIMPGTLTTSAELSTGRGTISFQAIESR